MNAVIRSLAMCLALTTGLCLPASCYGWGYTVHRFITETAMWELPEPLNTFFANHKTQIASTVATEPPGTHYIDIDYYPEFFTHTFPRDINALIAQYGSSVVNQYGTGPWTAVEYYQTLRAEFAAAQTEQDWISLLYTAGALAHYLEDLHNPMHLALNYNGQLTGQTGIHSRYERILIEHRIGAGLQLTTNFEDCVYYASIQDAIFDDIGLVYPFNQPLLSADLMAYAAAGERDSTNYYQHLWDDGCSTFTPFVMRRGAAMVASAWYSAWREAGFPQPFGVQSSQVVTLRLLSVDAMGCRLSVLGDAGQELQLQATTDFVDWTTHGTFTNLDGRIEITTPPPTEPSRQFYRVVLME